MRIRLICLVNKIIYVPLATSKRQFLNSRICTSLFMRIRRNTIFVTNICHARAHIPFLLGCNRFGSSFRIYLSFTFFIKKSVLLNTCIVYILLCQKCVVGLMVGPIEASVLCNWAKDSLGTAFLWPLNVYCTYKKGSIS